MTDEPQDKWDQFVAMVARVQECQKEIEAATYRVRAVANNLQGLSITDSYRHPHLTPEQIAVAKACLRETIERQTFIVGTERQRTISDRRHELEELRAAISSHVGVAVIDLGVRIRGIA